MDGGSKGDASSPGLGKGIGINKNSNNTNNKKTKNTKKTKQLEKEFEEQFWPGCPNKIGKGKAREAFVKARKGADLAAIIAGLPTYVAYEDGRRGQEGYRPLLPSTWLNQERWGDSPVQTGNGNIGSSNAMHYGDDNETADKFAKNMKGGANAR